MSSAIFEDIYNIISARMSLLPMENGRFIGGGVLFFIAEACDFWTIWTTWTTGLSNMGLPLGQIKECVLCVF